MTLRRSGDAAIVSPSEPLPRRPKVRLLLTLGIVIGVLYGLQSGWASWRSGRLETELNSIDFPRGYVPVETVRDGASYGRRAFRIDGPEPVGENLLEPLRRVVERQGWRIVDVDDRLFCYLEAHRGKYLVYIEVSVYRFSPVDPGVDDCVRRPGRKSYAFARVMSL